MCSLAAPEISSSDSRRCPEMSLNFADVTSQSLYARFLTRCKILRHGGFGFTSHPKEGVLRIFIAIINPSLRPDLNLLSLSPVASELTATHHQDDHLKPCIYWLNFSGSRNVSPSCRRNKPVNRFGPVLRSARGYLALIKVSREFE
jgi:hypothetical protein